MLTVFSLGWRIKGDLNIFISFSFFPHIFYYELVLFLQLQKSMYVKCSPYAPSNTILPRAPDIAMDRKGKCLHSQCSGRILKNGLNSEL